MIQLLNSKTDKLFSSLPPYFPVWLSKFMWFNCLGNLVSTYSVTLVSRWPFDFPCSFEFGSIVASVMKEFWKRQEGRLRAKEIIKNNTVIITTHYLFLSLLFQKVIIWSWILTDSGSVYAEQILNNSVQEGRTLIRREEGLVPNNVCIIATLECIAWLKNKYSCFLSPVQLEIICGYDFLYALLSVHGDFELGGCRKPKDINKNAFEWVWGSDGKPP